MYTTDIPISNIIYLLIYEYFWQKKASEVCLNYYNDDYFFEDCSYECTILFKLLFIARNRN